MQAKCTITRLRSPGAAVIDKAERQGLRHLFLIQKNMNLRSILKRLIIEQLEKHEVDFVVLAGYMRLIGTTLLETYVNRIINIHPSLLPAFPGMDAIGQAIKAGVKVTGVTIHFVDEGMDTGPIIAQKAIEISAEDTA